MTGIARSRHRCVTVSPALPGRCTLVTTRTVLSIHGKVSGWEGILKHAVGMTVVTVCRLGNMII